MQAVDILYGDVIKTVENAIKSHGTVVVVLRNHRRSRWRFPSRHPLLDLESMKYTQGVLTFGLVFCSTTEEADVLSVARTEHVRVRYVL